MKYLINLKYNIFNIKEQLWLSYFDFSPGTAFKLRLSVAELHLIIKSHVQRVSNNFPLSTIRATVYRCLENIDIEGVISYVCLSLYVPSGSDITQSIKVEKTTHI